MFSTLEAHNLGAVSPIKFRKLVYLELEVQKLFAQFLIKHKLYLSVIFQLSFLQQF
jgi:hypothetical protein